MKPGIKSAPSLCLLLALGFSLPLSIQLGAIPFYPVPRQRSSDSCGYAAIAGLLELKGTTIDEESLKLRYEPGGSTPLREQAGPLSLAEMASILSAEGCESIAVRVGAEELIAFVAETGPAVALLAKPSSHYALILGRIANLLVVGDPARGTVCEDIGSFRRRYSGYAILPEGYKEDPQRASLLGLAADHALGRQELLESKAGRGGAAAYLAHSLDVCLIPGAEVGSVSFSLAASAGISERLALALEISAQRGVAVSLEFRAALPGSRWCCVQAAALWPGAPPRTPALPAQYEFALGFQAVRDPLLLGASAAVACRAGAGPNFRSTASLLFAANDSIAIEAGLEGRIDEKPDRRFSEAWMSGGLTASLGLHVPLEDALAYVGVFARLGQGQRPSGIRLGVTL